MTADISGCPSSHEGYGLHLHSSAISMSTSPNTFAAQREENKQQQKTPKFNGVAVPGKER
ncbi:hypothetical protein M404DRAFT_23410 [Pisolithus tinctorius Marx 270]|uniref:Uncharacterized protein n=1 Tax=Pisolithus tinctorius Marx 270 TaxID=870435 RepID=A0A0C3PJ32_PISTI|nr:hypothetical protein M404DRAFT_23410 [Pisolithus tinctorius Marx 270]